MQNREYIHPGKIARDIPRGGIEGAKVMLINMPIRETARPNNPPIGPVLLATILRKYGAEAIVVDLNAYRENGKFASDDRAREIIKDALSVHGDQHLVGLSGLITTLAWQQKVARIVRELQPCTIIASGGGLATEFRETLFEWMPELNAVCHSEGDEAILKMAYDAKIIHQHGSVNIPAFTGKLDPYYLGQIGKNGKPLFSYDGGRPHDLDNIPFPDWNLLGEEILDQYISVPVWGDDANNSSRAWFDSKRSLSTISSRGCPFSCNFCYRKAQGERQYGMRSAGNLYGEMRTIRDRHDLDFIGIVDDNFMVSSKRIREFSWLARNQNFSWGTHGRLDEATHENLSLMAEAGCKYIGYGGESAHIYTLMAMNKGKKIINSGIVRTEGYGFPRVYVDGIKNTLQHGIYPNCTWIMGYPGEEISDLRNTIAFIWWQKSLYRPVNDKLFVATAYPGTTLFNTPVVKEKLNEAFGITYDKNGPIHDENLMNYVLQLDDASKVVENNGVILNYSYMDDDEFLLVKKYVENGETLKILEM